MGSKISMAPVSKSKRNGNVDRSSFQDCQMRGDQTGQPSRRSTVATSTNNHGEGSPGQHFQVRSLSKNALKNLDFLLTVDTVTLPVRSARTEEFLPGRRGTRHRT